MSKYKGQTIPGEDKKRKLLIGLTVAGAVIVIILLMALLYRPASSVASEENPVRKLESTSETYTRSVSAEEYEFYYNLTKRDLPANTDPTEIEEKAKEMAGRSIAEFSLGQKMGICQPYSFESLQRNMEKENDQRKIKKENGEVIYGPEEFDLITYYNYVTSNLEIDAVDYIAANADDTMLQNAEAYFEEHREDYRPISSIRYTITENEKTEEKTLLQEDMRTLERLDGELFEFLYYGEVGDTMEYFYGDALRTAKILAIEKEDPDFASAQAAALEDYVSKVYYEELVQKEMSHILLEFPK